MNESSSKKNMCARKLFCLINWIKWQVEFKTRDILWWRSNQFIKKDTLHYVVKYMSCFTMFRRNKLSTSSGLEFRLPQTEKRNKIPTKSHHTTAPHAQIEILMVIMISDHNYYDDLTKKISAFTYAYIHIYIYKRFKTRCTMLLYRSCNTLCIVAYVCGCGGSDE